MMQFLNLNEEEVLAAAKQAYPQNYIEYDHTDFYVRDIAKGTIHIDDVDYPLYVSTNYVYEDHVINGNDTRFKSKLSVITLKKDAYDVVYDSFGKYFVAYKEDTIKFVPYEDFYDMLKDHIHVEKEKSES
ncbi:hypothetical protein DXA09_03405 [Absiella sp. AM54-8XD]|nr:hypothetical protein DW271_09010 [Absiella sp. AM22-9]RGB62692.1 hypothetical protein DW120_02185 [Absiella sp. AM10-20]RGB69492.1 hypothetical protein DW113_02160 [Absiella sp. AM09-45]RGB77740.1 hypothetical protein DW114_05390 [Absiella sp. AM09-50]RGC25337.1 hypothetical protein DXA09_03405 [Absiella sp. AM54-8XD]RGC50167.1 hypothetical protein DW761_12825 [Absiella sp. AM29-15]RHU10053.1 hypothetical protein DW716_02330 [Absiella sp. AM27-20]